MSYSQSRGGRMKKICAVLLIAVFVCFYFGDSMGAESLHNLKTIQSKSLQFINSTYLLHSPINITSDQDFTNQFANRTIWGLEINGTGMQDCISIRGCLQPFTVKDCYLHNASNAGISLISSNGSLVNNNCSENDYIGIYLGYGSGNDTLTNNICSGNLIGIYLDNSLKV